MPLESLEIGKFKVFYINSPHIRIGLRIMLATGYIPCPWLIRSIGCENQISPAIKNAKCVRAFVKPSYDGKKNIINTVIVGSKSIWGK